MDRAELKQELATLVFIMVKETVTQIIVITHNNSTVTTIIVGRGKPQVLEKLSGGRSGT